MPRSRVSSPSVAVAVLLAAGMVVACQKAPDLTRDQARALIESSEAFRAPLNASAFLETKIANPASMKREFLLLKGLTIKPDGPWGMAGKTATVAFTWHWSNGPLAGVTFLSRAKLNTTGAAWRVYEDLLEKSLADAERGEE